MQVSAWVYTLAQMHVRILNVPITRMREVEGAERSGHEQDCTAVTKEKRVTKRASKANFPLPSWYSTAWVRWSSTHLLGRMRWQQGHSVWTKHAATCYFLGSFLTCLIGQLKLSQNLGHMQGRKAQSTYTQIYKVGLYSHCDSEA